MRTFYYLIAIIIAFQVPANGQKSDFEGEDFNGQVELVSGKNIVGDIFYEAATGKVIITNGDGSVYFTARTVSHFEFYDFERNSVRKFYSLLFNNNPTFFELLKETSSIALLSRENVTSSRAIAYLSKSSESFKDFYSDTQLLDSQSNSETLFLADEKGSIQPYVVINNNKLGTISNYISPYLLASITKGKYSNIRKYAKQNKYSLKNKEHLIEVLNFYEDLSKSN